MCVHWKPTQTKYVENAFFFNASFMKLKASWDYSSHHSGFGGHRKDRKKGQLQALKPAEKNMGLRGFTW